MAGLEELKKRIYKTGEQFKERTGEPSLVYHEKHEPLQWDSGEALPLKKHTRIWYWLIGGGIVAALAVVFVFVLIAPSSFFQVQAVDVELSGPKEIKSGDRISWTVSVINQNKTALESATLLFNFPEGSLAVSGADQTPITREQIELGILHPGQSVSKTFDAYVFGAKSAERIAAAVFEYRPQGSSARFAKTIELPFVIARSPISLEIDIPQELRLNQEVAFTVHYVSQAEQSFSRVGLIMRFPQGFTFVSASLAPEVNADKNQAFWNIGTLGPAQAGSILVKGSLSGADLDAKSFVGSIGITNGSKQIAQLYDEVTKSATLRSPFLDVSMEAVGVAEPGKPVKVNVRWRNNLPVEVRNPVLEISPGGDAADPLTFKPALGSYKNSSMIWNAGTYTPFSVISPGGSGEVSFIFLTKGDLARDSGSLRPIATFKAVFRNTGPISGFEGVDVSGSGFLEVKVTTKLAFAASGLYFNAPIPNTGPLPPRVGRETTYTVVWSLTNMSNDVDGATIRATLPPYMTFKNVIMPGDANVVYDENTGSVVWSAGRVQAGTGFLRPARQAAFQIGFIPLAVQSGAVPVLINPAVAEGTDSFTGTVFSLQQKEITTQLKDDPGIIHDYWAVTM